MRFSPGLDGLPGVINRCTYTRLALRDELHPDPHTPTPHARSRINGPNYRCVPYHGGFLTVAGGWYPGFCGVPCSSHLAFRSMHPPTRGGA